MTNPSNLPDTLLQSAPWNEQSHPIWPASSFTLKRNLACFPFSTQLSPSLCTQVLHLCKNACLQLPISSHFLLAEALSVQEKEFISEHFLNTPSWQHLSKPQACLIDPDLHFAALFHAQDHLTLHLIDCKMQWDQSWNTLHQIETTLNRHIDFAFSPKFGYLTSQLNSCGTGLAIHCYLHLPCLIETNLLPQLLISHAAPTVTAAGILGTTDAFLGDLVIISNRYAIGISEENILQDIHITATKLILAEKHQRTKYLSQASAEIKDTISRAYGLLKHSYQLETQEALSALSKIKLGIDLGCVKGMQDHEINEIFFRCRRAHLQQTQHMFSLDTKELAHTRAKYLHETLQNTVLTI